MRVPCLLQLVGSEDMQDTMPGLRGSEWLGRAQDIPQTLQFNVSPSAFAWVIACS